MENEKNFVEQEDFQPAKAKAVLLNNLHERFLNFVREAKDRKYYAELLRIAKEYPNRKSLSVDYLDLEKYDSEIADFLLSSPDDALKVLDAAIQDIDLPIEGEYKINARFLNLPKEQQVAIRDIRAVHIENMIGLEGIVKGATDVRPEAILIEYECPQCHKPISIPQFGRKIRAPSKCDDPACSARGIFSVHKTVLVDSQLITLQEPPEGIIGSEQPSAMRVHLTDDLVSPKERKKILPGNRIKITGIMRKIPSVTRTGVDTPIFDLFVDANHVDTIKREFEDIELNDDDKRQIREMSTDEHIVEKFISSIAPSIYGYSEIKEAILLQLFGGVTKFQPDTTRVRGNIHIFLIGDPAVGKSQLLRYVSQLAPKARFVSGKKSSGAGLTAAVVKDEFGGGGFTLEAGAMVLANKGVVCVDEFDKMDHDDMAAMLEAMEQGTISIAKAGIVTTLNADASVLAAANPKYGRFDQYKSVSDQIDLGNAGPVILSRFDLKFVIHDIPSVEKDATLAEHVLESLTSPDRIAPTLTVDQIRKYVAFARTTCKPKLTEDAKKLIKNFYVSWRSKSRSDGTEMGPISLTPRQLEALIRMSEASARIRLGDQVTADDAKRAIKLLEYSLKELGYEPETGKIDIDRIDVGISSVQRGRIHTMMTIISDLTKELGKDVPVEDIIVKAKERGIEDLAVRDVIQKMIEKGDLYEPRPGFLRKP